MYHPLNTFYTLFNKEIMYNHFHAPKVRMSFVDYTPKGIQISTGKPKKKEFGVKKLSRKQRKK